MHGENGKATTLDGNVPETRRRLRPTSAFVITLLVLIVGIIPLPGKAARSFRRTFRSVEPNRADRDASAGGYYEGLVNVGIDGGRGDLTARLLGRPTNAVSFNEIGATRYLPGDLLQFDLAPNLRRQAFGQPFNTNAHGQRDREYAATKPPGTFRIALLGSSMDMGWGVGNDETYENRLEDWLNHRAENSHLARRYELLNFAVAAYSPLHRLEVFRRKILEFEPDLVIYSATLLDPRLLEIHICGLLQDRLEPDDFFVRQALAQANLLGVELPRDSKGALKHKEALKARLRPQLWPIIDGVLEDLAGECRSRKLPLICVIIPRAGNSDLPEDRSLDVERYKAIATRHGVPVVDLTAAFDQEEPAAVEIAPWDDHPNARGHKLLFQALAERILEGPSLYRTFFGAGADSSCASNAPENAASNPLGP